MITKMNSNNNQRVPMELDCTNLSTEWPIWKRNFMVYMVANNKISDTESTKIATFLWLVGTNGSNIYNTLYPNDGSSDALLGTTKTTTITPADPNVEDSVETSTETVVQRSLDEVLKKFDDHCLPQKNVAMESFKFNMILQKEKQSFNEFETELRTQLRRCDFGCTCGISYEERMLRDRIIIGVFDKKLQLKLLDGRDEPLARVIETCKIYEAANANKIILDKKQSVDSIITSTESTVFAVNTNRFCFNCGDSWNPKHLESCKAKDISCKGCGKKGHFQRMCRRSKGKSTERNNNASENSRNSSDSRPNTGKNAVSALNWNSSGSTYVNFKSERTLSYKFIYRINSAEKSKWTKDYRIGNQTVEFKIDTGADVNCIPMKIINKINSKFCNQNCDLPLFDYSNNKIEIFGIIKLECFESKTNKSKTAEFVIVNNQFEPILGLDTCIKFGLVKRLDVDVIACLPEQKNEFLERNKDIFGGLGKFPGTFSIKLHENSKPILHYKKRIPLALVDKLKVKLDQMVQDEIISPVDYPTDWVNNLQIVEKPNSNDLRICLDPKPLNTCIKREHFLIPTIDDLTSKLAKKSFFSVLDLSSGFWHMELDGDSSNLTTFMTPFGRFKFNRVPFGLNCAPEMFQGKMVKLFGDLKGVMVYFDDIVVYADDEREHDKIMQEVIDRARKNNIRFNTDKIQYRRREVKFMGYLLSEGTVKPDAKYSNAILGMKKPKDKSAVLRFLGLLKYIARFIPNLSKLTAELRNLTRNDVQFEWTDAHEGEFTNLLNIVTSEQTLAIYDPGKPVIVQTDASKDGLGCVLIQDGRPVSFASRTLSRSEQKWAQIEKELLAIVFACQRFHFFLYGRSFTVESDHKPLETLIKRDIDDVTTRLQRMFMFLLKYPNMTVMYKPGRDMLIADCLSRAQLTEIEEIDELSSVIHSITKSVCISEDNYNLYRKIMKSDEKYKRICHFVENKWPGFHQLDEFSQHFHKLKSELHVENDLLFYNHRLVIPKELQQKIAKWLHESHLGIEKTLSRARMLYYWPGMNSQIKGIIETCEICEKFKRNNQKEPLKQEENPMYPYAIAAMDLFEYAGHDFIAIIDSYSNYLTACRLNNKTSKHIIERIREIFDKIGYPSIIRCDNSPFGSAEFDRFASEFNIQFGFSSPRYPQSNGLAEKGVAIAKNILKRCYESDGVDQFQYRILEYNTTPVAGMKLTPSELFFGRLIKTKLPVINSKLTRNNIPEEEIKQKIENKRGKQKYYYDRNAKSLPKLVVGDTVIFKKNCREWNYGIIVGDVNGKSYIIRDSFDNHFRRNRKFIARSKNTGFNASDLLFDENVKISQNACNDQLGEIQIVSPSIQTPNGNSDSEDCEVNEPELSTVDSDTSVSSSDEFETAGSNGSGSESESNSDAPPIVNLPLAPQRFYTTRSGRAVKPRKLYGFD